MLRMCWIDGGSKRLSNRGVFQDLREGEKRLAIFKSGRFERLKFGDGLEPFMQGTEGEY